MEWKRSWEERGGAAIIFSVLYRNENTNCIKKGMNLTSNLPMSHPSELFISSFSILAISHSNPSYYSVFAVGVIREKDCLSFSFIVMYESNSIRAFM